MAYLGQDLDYRTTPEKCKRTQLSRDKAAPHQHSLDAQHEPARAKRSQHRTNGKGHAEVDRRYLQPCTNNYPHTPVTNKSSK